MQGTIKIDIGALSSLLGSLSSLKLVLDGEKNLIPLLTTQLGEAIGGPAPSITDFDHKFCSWMQLLTTLSEDIDSAYTTLNTVLTDALNIEHVL